MVARLDLHDANFTAAFAAAPLYRKVARVRAIQVVTPTPVRTVLADGTVETEHRAVSGEFIITNPGGEQYVVAAAKFYRRYAPTAEPGVYDAIGQVRALPNPTGEPIMVTAPLGDDQYGEADCFVAMAVELPGHRYIIGAQEFRDTYVPVP